MQLSGKVVNVYEAKNGTSDRGCWIRQNIVIETNEIYPKKICFEVSNPNLINFASVGEMVVVTFFVVSREYDGRWFTTAKAVGLGKMSAVNNFTQL